MSCMKRLTLFVAALISFISYANAHENRYVFIGENNNQIAFVLDLLNEDVQNYVRINENGEVWLKADKIVSVPASQLATAAPLSYLNNTGDLSNVEARSEEQEVKCPKCRFYYVPRPP